MSDSIHIHNQHHFDKTKLFILMIPVLVFLLVLAIYMTATKYITPHTAANEAINNLQNNAIAKENINPVIPARLGDVNIFIEVADTPEKRALGLGQRQSLPEDHGMLFVFGEGKRPVRFWMKGMEFPLDMLFISDGKVMQITKNAEPEPNTPESSLKAYVSDQPVEYVLEVNGGFTEKHGISVSDDFIF